MARWALRAPHYLKVEGIQWEYKATTNTGKVARQMYDVPLLLNPENPGDCNYPGEIIVAYKGSPHRADYIFEGEPTPDMEPLDDEAQAISDSFRHKWTKPFDNLPLQGDISYADNLAVVFQKALDDAFKRNGAPQSGPMSVNDDRMKAIEEQMAQLLKRNAELEELVAAKAAEAPAVERRV